MANLSDLFKEEEEARLATARAEIAQEKAAWDALTPEEREQLSAAYEAKYALLEEASVTEEEGDDDD